ncbi:MAG TPA: hypothetical protein VIK89_15910 [Cytophagaceae bacterium]
MDTKKNHGTTMKFFLWSAFIIYTTLLVACVIWHIEVLTIVTLLFAMMLLLILQKHVAYTKAPDKSNERTFYKYLFKLIRHKNIENNLISKATIHYSPNPDKEKNEGLLHSDSRVHLKDNLKVSVGNEQCAYPANFHLLNIDIPNYSFINKKVIVPLQTASEEASFFYSIHGEEEYNSNNGNIILKLPVNKAFDSIIFKNFEPFLEKNLNTGVIKAIELIPDASPKSCYTLTELTGKIYNPISGNYHQLLHLIKELRRKYHGIPIGIRTGISGQEELNHFCKAINDTGILIDFINIIGTKSHYPVQYTGVRNSILILEQAVALTALTLKKHKLEKDIKICATGSIDNGFEALKLISLGANMCMTIKPSGFFNTLKYEYGEDNKEIVLKNQIVQFHKQIRNEVVQLMEYAGFETMENIDPKRFFRKINTSTVKTLEDIYINKEYQFNLRKYEVLNHLN